jgi:hypothetical protein
MGTEFGMEEEIKKIASRSLSSRGNEITGQESRTFFKKTKWSKMGLLKLLGSILVLVATTGFGFHQWRLNNDLADLSVELESVRNSQELYIRADDRYRTARSREAIELVIRNQAVPEGLSDIIKKQDENMVTERRIAYAQLAAVAEDSPDSKTYMAAIIKKVDDSEGDLQKLQYIYNEIMEKLGQKISSSKERKSELMKKIVEQKKERDSYHFFYILIQLVGIFCVAIADVFLNHQKQNGSIKSIT